MAGFKGLLFDFDGTLVKTMEDHYAAWRHVLKEYGIDLKAEDYYPLEGMPMGELASIFASNAPDRKANAELFAEVVKKKEQYYLSRANLQFYPGVESLIKEFHRCGMPMGIVTAGLRPRVESTIPKEFLKYFSVLITGGDTAKGKPHPDPYLRGAEALGMDAGSCVVVENAPLGVQSAKSAGAYCIAVCSTLDRSRLTGADQVIDSFEELKNLTVIKEIFQTNGAQAGK